MNDTYEICRRPDKSWWKISGDNAFESVLDGYPEYEKVYLNVCKERGTVIQAGGYCGIFPYYLSKQFDVVYTFEPDHSNFYCLTINTLLRENVIKFQAGLSEYSCMGHVHRVMNTNRVMNRVSEGLGDIPIMRIDDFNLDDCSLIALDTEGFERNILYGARHTIAKFHPVISIEDDNEYTREYLNLFDYKKVDEVYRDTIYA